MSKTAQKPEANEEPSVPFPRVIGLVRQLTHDIRNGLNNVDLQAALLQELVTDAEVTPEIKRLRGMVTETAKWLQELSRMFWLPEPNFVTYSASAFIEDFRSRLAKSLPQSATHLDWQVALQEEMIPVDIEMIFRGLAEFFKNAFHFREGETPISVSVAVEGQTLVVKLVEPKSAVASAPEKWGNEPLVSTRRSGFGMGLYYTRQVIDAHQGKVEQAFDEAAKRLTTTVVLPLASR
jgi:K+-sensing histidine kinase KdpD